MQSLYLLYHELRADSSSYTYVLPYQEFDRHCELFARLQRPDSGTLRPELTFDDGHRSNHDLALPALQRHRLEARFFITTGWTGIRAEYMDWPEIRALHAAGHEIGAHGWTHTLLTHCTPAQLKHELVDARLSLEDGIGHPVTSMSLPGGRSNRRVLDACWNAGYTEVFSSVPRTEPAVRTPGSAIGRLNLRSGVQTEWLARLLDPHANLLARLQQQERIKSAARLLLGDKIYAKLWAMINHQERQADSPAGSPR
jgi:hypothetical protein